jgi:carbon monoxide dehydrogenase subunit G
MRIEGRHSFTKSRREIWQALQDPQTLAATLPGVERLEATGPDRYELSASVGVGGVTGKFEGSLSVEDKVDFESCVLRGSARGAPGSARVEAMIRLSDANGGGAALSYGADATVTGPIAGVGQRMVAAAARRTAERFLTAVDSYDAAAEPATSARDGGAPDRAAAAEADAGAFARGVVVGFALAIVGIAVGRWSRPRSR